MTTKKKTTTTAPAAPAIPCHVIGNALSWAVRALDVLELHELTVEAVRAAVGGEKTSLALSEIGAIELACLSTRTGGEEDDEMQRRIDAAWNRLRPKHKVAGAYRDFIVRFRQRAYDPTLLLVAIMETYGDTSTSCFVDELVGRATEKKKAAA